MCAKREKISFKSENNYLRVSTPVNKSFVLAAAGDHYSPTTLSALFNGYLFVARNLALYSFLYIFHLCVVSSLLSLSLCDSCSDAYSAHHFLYLYLSFFSPLSLALFGALVSRSLPFFVALSTTLSSAFLFFPLLFSLLRSLCLPRSLRLSRTFKFSLQVVLCFGLIRPTLSAT